MNKVEIIDPPVSQFSSLQSIEDWIEELNKEPKPWSEQRKIALVQAEQMLKTKRSDRLLP